MPATLGETADAETSCADWICAASSDVLCTSKEAVRICFMYAKTLGDGLCIETFLPALESALFA